MTREILKVIATLGEENWGALLLQRLNDIVEDEPVAALVLSDLSIDLLDAGIGICAEQLEIGLANDEFVFEGAGGGLLFCIDGEADCPKLKLEDRVMSVASTWSGGQPDNVVGLDLAHDALK